jgi:alkaline phosphatase D
LFSLPSASRRIRITHVAVNTILLLAAIDFVIHPFFDPATDVVFTRVGAVYPDSVNIIARYPEHNATESHVKVVWREFKEGVALEEGWRDGPILKLTEENDWVSTVTLRSLWPTTAYEYRLSSLNRTILPYPSTPISFRTFPDPRLPVGTHFRFIVSSCVTPNFPYVPFQSRRIKGFDLLARYLWPTQSQTISVPPLDTSSSSEASGSAASTITSAPAIAHTSPPPTEFLLFLGDFVYADVPFYFGDDKEAYRRLYRRNYISKSFRKIYQRLPVFHTYDDHEIINNFQGLGNDSTPPFPNASDAFKLYNSNGNYESTQKDQYYYDFRYGDVAFFVMDTRRYRSNVFDDDVHSRTMLGDQQLAAFYDWLGKVNSTATFKFVVSSVPFTALWGHDAQTDAWPGYPNEKAALLKALHSVPNIIILSGDRHEFAAIEFNGDEKDNGVLEFSTSPMSMFYVPFFRTLKKTSDAMIQRVKTEVVSTEDGKEVVRTKYEIPQEKVLRYIASGNYKWSAFEVDTRDLAKPTLKLEVMIDGSAAYHLTIAGKPVKLHSSTALGALVPPSFNKMFHKMGLRPSKWF